MVNALTINDTEFKKHVGLIHSTNHLSLLERKIANALLYNAYKDMKDQEEHKIHIGDLCKLIGYNSNDEKTIKNSLISLISTVLEWNILEKNKSNAVWVASSMLSDAKIDGAICTYSYSKRMRELCYFPELYAVLNLKTIASFKSTYGIALYENCIRYRKIKHTPWMEMDLYRKLMGVPPGKYTKFKDLNTRVIKKSIEEVNNRSTILVEPEYQKFGRSISKIRFLIHESSDDSNVINSDIVQYLIVNYGYSNKAAIGAVKEYGENYIKEKIAMIEDSASYRNGSIKNLSSYLQSALENNFQSAKSSKQHMHKKKLVETKQDENEKELKDSYNRYLSSKFEDIIELIDSNQKKEVANEFEKSIKNTVHHTIYIKDGYNNVLVRDKFLIFLKVKYREVLDTYCSFERFKEMKSQG